MLHSLGDDHQASLDMFRTAEEVLKSRLQKTIGDDWQDRTDLIIHEDEDIRTSYKAWREARNGIDTMLEKIKEAATDTNA